METKVGKMDVFIPFVLDGSGGWAGGAGPRGRGQVQEGRGGECNSTIFYHKAVQSSQTAANIMLISTFIRGNNGGGGAAITLFPF